MNHRFSIILFLAVVGKFGMAGELASVAPQVKIPVKISLIDQVYLLKKNVLVRDVATCEGYDVSCNQIGDVEIGVISPDTKSLRISEQDIRRKIMDESMRVRLTFSGLKVVFVYPETKSLKWSSVESVIDPWLRKMNKDRRGITYLLADKSEQISPQVWKTTYSVSMDENFQKNILMGKNNIENIAVRLNLKSATREDLNQVITPSIKLKMRYKVLVLNHGQQKDAVLSESMFNTAEIDGPIVKSHYRYSGVFLLQDYEFRRRVRAGAILTNQMIRKHLVLKEAKKSEFP